MPIKAESKMVRVISSQGTKLRVNVPAVKAPRPVVGAGLSCCCKQE